MEHIASHALGVARKLPRTTHGRIRKLWRTGGSLLSRVLRSLDDSLFGRPTVSGAGALLVACWFGLLIGATGAAIEWLARSAPAVPRRRRDPDRHAVDRAESLGRRAGRRLEEPDCHHSRHRSSDESASVRLLPADHAGDRAVRRAVRDLRPGLSRQHRGRCRRTRLCSRAVGRTSCPRTSIARSSTPSRPSRTAESRNQAGDPALAGLIERLRELASPAGDPPAR